MSLLNVNINTNLVEQYPEYITYDSKLKDKYGEVNTPYRFIMNKMFSMFQQIHFKNKNLKWLDAGAGRGNFSLCLFVVLFNELKEAIPNHDERKAHIIQNMIYMVELNEDNIIHLREKFSEKANIYNTDYIQWDTDIRFDFIIGNPPYNCDGVKKVPTKTDTDKKKDGKTIWPEFVKKNISLLKDDGIMNILIPSIPVNVTNAAKSAKAVKAAEPIANPLPIAAVVFPTASSLSVLSRTSLGSSSISAIPPALSEIGPYASTAN